MSKLQDIVDEVPDEARALWAKMDSIAERIIQLMELQGLNQQELAESMGKHKSYISRVLGGGVNLTLKTIVEFEQALGGALLSIPSEEESEAYLEDTEPSGESKAPRGSAADPSGQTASRGGVRLPASVEDQLHVRARFEGVLPETLATKYVVFGMAQDSFAQELARRHYDSAARPHFEGFYRWATYAESRAELEAREPVIVFGRQTITETEDGGPQDVLLRLLYDKADEFENVD